jgi:4-hydroxyphenylacetate 3-monooxygenase
MLRTGKDYLAALNDGRSLYIGGERVNDVTTHPAFQGAAKTFASLFDMKADPANADIMSFEEDGEHFAMYYLMPRNAEDLLKRTKCHKAIAAQTYGLMGRSPDHVSSFVTAIAMTPDILDQQEGRSYSSNIVNYYNYLRKNDLYVTYAVHPAPQSKNQSLFGDTKGRQAVMRVTSEDENGVTLNGMKMLATAGMFCDEVWIGNLTPISEDRKKEAITCAIPMNTPGLSLWARKPMELHAVSDFESPLSSRYDEGDVMLIFEDVHVPWDRVFVHDHPHLSREVYLDTAAHSFGNHQSNVRAHEKIKFLVGLIHKIATSAGVDKIPVVAEKIGRMAAFEATLSAMIYGQIQDHETLEGGFVNYNRRYMAAALNWCQEHFPIIIAELREISGGSVFQMPADISVLGNPETRDQFLEYWRTDKDSAIDRVKLYKLAWDIFGSEFGNRHTQYENFYAGASFVVRSHSARYAPWADLDQRVDDLLATIKVPEEYSELATSAVSAAE